MTAREHSAEAERRLRASDYQWRESADTMDTSGALREAVVAQAHATLALADAVAAIVAFLNDGTSAEVVST